MEPQQVQKGDELRVDFEASNSLSVVSPRNLLGDREEEKCASSNPKKKKKIAKNIKAKDKEKRRADRKGKCSPTFPESSQSQSNPPTPPAAGLSTHPTEQRHSLSIKPVWQSFETSNLETFHQDIDRTYFCPVTEEQLEQVRLNTAAEKPHIAELLNGGGARVKASQSNLRQYLGLLREIRVGGERELGVLWEWRDRYAVLFYQRRDEGEGDGIQMSGNLELTESEHALLKIRHLFMCQLSKKLNKFNQNRPQKSQLDQLSKQILFFSNFLSVQSNKLQKQLSNLQQKAHSDLQPEISASAYQDEYIAIILRKNVQYSLKYHDLDVINYFKMRSCIEQNKKFEPFTTTKDLAEYVKKKMVRKTKKTKYPLPTACKGCLSNYYEQYNTFKNCYECGSRFHRLCLSISNNLCTICQGRRLKRTLTPECILCPQRGIMYKTLSQNNNIHIWCAIAFGLFKVKDKVIQLTPPQLTQTQQQCFLCQQNTGRLIRCECTPSCPKLVHPLCGYLNGYHLSLPATQVITFNCSINSQPEQLLVQEFNRCYMLNHNKVAYNCYSLEEFRRSKQVRAPKTNKSNGSEENVGEEEEEVGEGNEREDREEREDNGGKGRGRKIMMVMMQDDADDEVPFIESD